MGRALRFFGGLGPTVERAMTDNGPGPRQRRVQRAAGGRRRPAHIHEALQPVAERQGGADEPHRRAGVAIRTGLGRRGRESVRPPGLHRALQSGASAQRVREPAAHVARRRRKQPVGTQHLETIDV